MEEEIRVHRSHEQSGVRHAEQMPHAAHRPRRTSSAGPIITTVIVIIVILAAVAGVLFKGHLFGLGNTNGSYQYQAVFLTNGQVYFGKLSDQDSDYLKLTDVYYLQVEKSGLQGSAEATSTTDSQGQVSLIKLGNELHGPADEMYISRSQVLFYENLKSDSSVVKAIEQYASASSSASSS